VGATAAEARQQLVLRTFASTSGDAARTGKVLGLSEKDVREELMAMLQGGAKASTTGAASNGASEDKPGRTARRNEPVPARSSAKKSTAKRSR
jgi:hypothetical protein